MSVPGARPMVTHELLSLYEGRLRRIVEECYEVAFILCNGELEDFGLGKVFDIFDQIFTTAFILNTGYWPFFSSIRGQSLCVCGRFGVHCRHVKNEYHWIDMQPLENDQSCTRFFPRIHGNIFPQDYEVVIKPLTDGIFGYNISIAMHLQYRKADRVRPLRRDKVGKPTKEQLALKKEKEIYKQSFSSTICARYKIHPEFYPAVFTIVFQPNPFFHEQYGTYFRKLHSLRNFEWPQCTNELNKYYHVSVGQMPTATLILENANVPVYALPKQIVVVYPPAHCNRNRLQKLKRNKSSQTPWKFKIWNEGEDEVDIYNHRLRDVTNVWTYPPDTQILSDSIRSIASSTMQAAITNSADGNPILMEDSEEYDNQFPNMNCNRAVKGQGFGQGVKRKCPSWAAATIKTEPPDANYNSSENNVIQYTGTCPKSRTTQNNPFHIDFIDGMPFTLDTRQAFPYLYDEDSKVNISLESRVAFPYLSNEVPEMSTSQLNYSEAVKKSPVHDFQPSVSRCEDWFEKSFPPLRPKLNKSEIDEEFELIETVIREDSSYGENNLLWWNATN